MKESFYCKEHHEQALRSYLIHIGLVCFSFAGQHTLTWEVKCVAMACMNLFPSRCDILYIASIIELSCVAVELDGLDCGRGLLGQSEKGDVVIPTIRFASTIKRVLESLCATKTPLMSYYTMMEQDRVSKFLICFLWLVEKDLSKLDVQTFPA